MMQQHGQPDGADVADPPTPGIGAAPVAVNLLWCVPGDVGGSEEYLVRQLKDEKMQYDVQKLLIKHELDRIAALGQAEENQVTQLRQNMATKATEDSKQEKTKPAEENKPEAAKK